MKKKVMALVIVLFSLMISGSVFAEGYLVTSDLWIRAVIDTVEKGPIDAVFYKGGEKTTSRGDTVIWGYFYANPDDVSWGDQGNPDLYVKIWFDVTGRIDVNYFHVSVPNIEVFSDYPYDGTCDQYGTTTMDYRYIRHEYWIGSDASIVGSWGSGHYTDPNDSEYRSLTFYPNGYYIHYESDDPSSEDDNGGGVEYGKYDYNSQTGKLVVTSLIVNENGDHGLSDFVPGGDCEATVTIDGDTITFSETCEGGWTETNTIERVKSDSSPIVGSWGLGYYTDLSDTGSEYMSLTFYPNGYYIHWQSDKPLEPDDNGGGVEYGNYTYNATTQQMTINPIFDENGCIGPSEDGQDTQWQVIVGADILTVYDDGEVDCTLERVE